MLTSDWSTDGAAAAPRGGRARPRHGRRAARGRAQPRQGQQGEQVQTRHPQAEGQNHRVRRGVPGGEYESNPIHNTHYNVLCAAPAIPTSNILGTNVNKLQVTASLSVVFRA